jgi:hypothetical protein
MKQVVLKYFKLIFGSRTHLKKVHAKEYAVLTKSGNESEGIFDPTIANRLLSRLIGPSTVSFNMDSSPELRNLASYLNPNYQLPSRGTLTKLILEEANHVKKIIQSLLASAPMVIFGFLNFKLYLINSFAVVNVHIYVEQLCVQKTVCLGVCGVLDHKNESIYAAVAELLQQYDQRIQNVRFINTDNASANLKAFR